MYNRSGIAVSNQVCKSNIFVYISFEAMGILGRYNSENE